MRRIRQMQQSGGRGGGGPQPQMPKAAGGFVIGGLVLAAGAYVFSNALFNVDGGHRAIKYTRIGGVSKEIYNEGQSTSFARVSITSGSSSIELNIRGND